MKRREERNTLKKLMAIRGMGQVITVTFGLIVLCIVFGILNPTFSPTGTSPTCSVKLHLFS